MESHMPLRPLGRSGVHVPALGVGTNRWGRGRGADQLAPVFSAALDAGANLFDTAEVYLGSEKTIGACLRRDPRPALVVTKFAPYPTRLSARSFHKALEGSLARLGRDAVGVSNFSARQMRAAAERLERHGIPLAANEVQFSVFHRDPERNGVLAACRELDVTLIAYRPLAGGRVRPAGSALDGTLAGIARARQRTVAQVALAWLLCQDERIVAIPGATSVEHLRQNIGAAGWTLGGDELAALERPRD